MLRAMHAYSGHPCTVVALKLSPLLLVRPGELQALTGHGRYVFGTSAKADRPMSENTVNKALQAMGYPGSVQTAHGFRASARTIMDEVLNERVDLIEHQLAHTVKDANGRAYNRTSYVEQRRAMMQTWANCLDKLRMGADVIELHSKAA